MITFGQEEAPALALRSPGWAFPRALIPDTGAVTERLSRDCPDQRVRLLSASGLGDPRSYLVGNGRQFGYQAGVLGPPGE